MSSASARLMRSFVQVNPAPVEDLSMIVTTQEESKGHLSTLDSSAAASLGYESDIPDDEPIEMPPADEGGDLDAGNGPHKNVGECLMFLQESSAIMCVTFAERSWRKPWTQLRNLSSHTKPHLQVVTTVFRPSEHGRSKVICSWLSDKVTEVSRPQKWLQ